MNKNRIRLTESQLCRIIIETLQDIYNKYGITNRNGNDENSWDELSDIRFDRAMNSSDKQEARRNRRACVRDTLNWLDFDNEKLMTLKKNMKKTSAAIK